MALGARTLFLYLLPAVTLTSGTAVAADLLPAEKSLARLESRVDRLHREVVAARRRVDAPPALFAREVERLRRDREDAVEGLAGRHWTAIAPALRAAEALQRQLAAVESELADWRRNPARGREPLAAPSGGGTGAISGRMVDAVTGATLSQDHVHVVDQAGTNVAFGDPDGTGGYTAASLEPGTYFVVTHSFDHLNELYDNLPCDPDCDPTKGTPIAVAAGTTTAGIDFALVPLSTVGGTVTDADTGLPLPSVEVTAYDSEGFFAGSGSTNSLGEYRIFELHAGVHFVRARSDTYLDELHDGIVCEPDCEPEDGTPVMVPLAGSSTVDFGMVRGGSLTGAVTDATTGDPIFTSVRVFAADGSQIGFAGTNSAGQYHVFDLPAGTYTVRTSTFDYADELWNDRPCEPTCDPTQGTPISVAVGQVREDVDFALLRMGSFSGRVVDVDTNVPLPEAEVLAFDDQGVLRTSAQADASGEYRAGGLAAGFYRARTVSPQHLDELFDDIPCEGGECVLATGTPIPVSLGANSAGIDFRLRRGGWMAGRVVREATGQPVERAFVSVYRPDATLVGSTLTGATGAYVFPGLPAGSYRAVAEDFDFEHELFQEMPCPFSGCDPAAGTPIAVLVAQETAGVNFTLRRLGHIAGQVREAGTSLPVTAFVKVHGPGGVLIDLTTSNGGSYLVTGLRAGTYFVVTQSFSGQNFLDELWNDVVCEPSCDVTQGTPVTVALDATVSGIDFSLQRPTFADVPVDHFAWRYAEAVFAAGITSGCASAPRRFCPGDPVNRDQMAVFLLRAKEGASYQPPPATGVFADVPVSGVFAPWIEELARRGIASGCATNPPRYCPAQPTTRAQMAPLLLVTREGGGFTPPPAVGVFDDMPASSPFARWVEELVRRGVTGGCSVSPRLFCAGSPTSRAQMAVFLTTTFGLPLP